jgi:phage FluMu gp28-like protein
MDSLKRPRSRRSARPKRKNERSRDSVAAASSPPPRPASVPGDGDIAATATAIRLLPYQQRWVADTSPLKIVVKARQIGYSYAAAMRAVLACLKRKTTWIFLSKGERQSRLLMEKVAEHVRSCGAVARALESTYFEGTLIRQLETRFPNGSVIYGLPANPDTARGYTGNVTLDEFAFHADAAKIYAALFPSITRGYGLEVISTPNGTQGKFYELAKAAGLTNSGEWPVVSGKQEIAACRLPLATSAWSAHRCDIYEAVREGLRIDLRLLRSGCEDETAWQQEFCCEFVSTAENFFPPELLAACLSAEASADAPISALVPLPSGPPTPPAASARNSGFGVRDSGLVHARRHPEPSACHSERSEESALSNRESRVASPEFFLGIDIGRRHDRTVFWLDEVEEARTENRNSKLETRDTNFEFRVSSFDAVPHRSVARLVKTFANTPFSEQLAYARELMRLRGGGGEPLISRVAIDATGIGSPLAESLAQEFGPRVEPVVFTAAMKEDLAYRTRRRMEDRLTRLPDTREVRAAFSAVKRFVTATGSLRFDAARTEAGHADQFWAKALADYAADLRPASSAQDAFFVDGAPTFDPRVFAVPETGFLGAGAQGVWEGTL